MSEKIYVVRYNPIAGSPASGIAGVFRTKKNAIKCMEYMILNKFIAWYEEADLTD